MLFIIVCRNAIRPFPLAACRRPKLETLTA